MTDDQLHIKATDITLTVCETLNQLCKDEPREVYLEAVGMIFDEVETILGDATNDG